MVYMRSGVFRGKESSNRIELSQLVQDLLNFSVLGSLQLWGGGRWVAGVWGHLAAWRMSSHAWTCTHTHVYMYTNCKWPPTWRHPCLSCLSCLTCMSMHAYVHAYVCICAWDTTPQPYTHSYPHPPICHPPGEPLESVKIR